jgi:TRAP-type C4-dicarboxylate transport system substrate-binding protein
VYTPAYVTVGLKKWNALPADVRATVERVAKETQGFVYDQAAKLETDLLAKIRAAGVAINEADKKAFIEASADIYKEFSSSVSGGKEMIDKSQKLRGM